MRVKVITRDLGSTGPGQEETWDHFEPESESKESMKEEAERVIREFNSSLRSYEKPRELVRVIGIVKEETKDEGLMDEEDEEE